jgi:hypothetical protein
MKTSVGLKVIAGAALLALPLMASAESSYQTGAGPLTATAHVDFQVNIPKVLYLRVGTGSAYPATLSSVATFDLVQFSPTAAQVGNGTAIAGTGGDLAGGVETAAIISNSGNVTLNATTTGKLGDGTVPVPNTISFGQIATAATALTGTYTLLNPPVLVDGATSANVVLTAPATKTITADAKWTYTYLNTVTPPAGTYGGVNTNNGRVVYTATMP